MSTSTHLRYFFLPCFFYSTRNTDVPVPRTLVATSTAAIIEIAARDLPEQLLKQVAVRPVRADALAALAVIAALAEGRRKGRGKEVD